MDPFPYIYDSPSDPLLPLSHSYSTPLINECPPFSYSIKLNRSLLHGHYWQLHSFTYCAHLNPVPIHSFIRPLPSGMLLITGPSALYTWLTSLICQKLLFLQRHYSPLMFALILCQFQFTHLCPKPNIKRLPLPFHRGPSALRSTWRFCYKSIIYLYIAILMPHIVPPSQ